MRGAGARARRGCGGACSPGLWPSAAPQQFFGWWQPVVIVPRKPLPWRILQPSGSRSPGQVLRQPQGGEGRFAGRAKGEVVGLLGPNGAGKTTSFYMIVGLVRSDGGDIRIDGQSVAHMPSIAARGWGCLTCRKASIFRKLSVEENVRAVLELQRDAEQRPLSRAAMKSSSPRCCRSCAWIIARLAALALSGGERRRAEIARALATQPRFILLDEPFAGIDPIAVIEIQRIIGFLKARGIGVLITDHNVRETWAFATTPSSSAMGGCWRRARHRRSWTTPRCAACTWANTSACDGQCECGLCEWCARAGAWAGGSGMKPGLSLRVSQHLA